MPTEMRSMKKIGEPRINELKSTQLTIKNKIIFARQNKNFHLWLKSNQMRIMVL